MGGNEDRPPSSTSSQLSKPKPPPRGPPRPTITLPPRPFADTIFNSGPGVGSGFGLGFSPGPMTLVSSFFSDSDEFKSFSQLLAGAMASPAAVQQRPVLPPPPPNDRSSGVADVSSSGIGGGGTSRTSGVDLQFRHNRPPGLVIAQPPPMFTVPPGLSPATLLDSPGFGLFSPGPYGMTHQQALAQVTAQAAQSNSHAQVQAEYSSLAPAAAFGQLPSFTVDTAADQQIPPSIPDSRATKESPDLCLSEQRSQQSSHNVDKPADDGYNWRKYGQKQVKGSEFPRSYYKCTHPNCPVKKKVERSLAGHVTEIIYKGQHNHQPPKLNKRAKDTGNSNGNSLNQVNAELPSQFQSGNSNKSKEGASAYSMPKRNQETSQATAEHLSASSDSEEVAGAEAGVDEKDEDESDTKRRCTEATYSESASSHRTVTEPRIIVQTTSEVDLLDDGYRWRKYGQKVVKGNPYPRSYYKCTTPGCNVRKHVERASTDPKAVVTTYEGRHNHEVPTARNSSHNTANTNASQLRPPNVVTETRALSNNNQQPIARLLLKEEQVT